LQAATSTRAAPPEAVEPATQELPVTTVAILPACCSRNVWLDCAARRMVGGSLEPDGTAWVAELTLDPLAIARRVPHCSERAADTLRVDEPRRRIWWVDDTGSAYRMGLDDLRCEAVVPGHFVRDLGLDPQSGDPIVLDQGRLRRFDAAAGAFGGDVELPSPFSFLGPWARRLGQVAVDARRGRIHATDIAAGRLYVVALGRLEIERVVALGRGVRHVTLDDRRDLLYVGNFVTGDLHALDAETLDVRRTSWVGPRIRDLALSHDGDRLTFVTAAGGVLIDLDAWLPR
jgi:hypothetical protein